ncbi:hypothetical protein MKZ38_010297 [Zalerion maritima]|uniref:Uncharacterized protein n=1 Tax=Zalerion maritima TaxID=339359 RepID=A0AAD5WT13_9PEZI|nr:hypothetical protein MKZ38_010297 [Zalerion maritima]
MLSSPSATYGTLPRDSFSSDSSNWREKRSRKTLESTSFTCRWEPVYTTNYYQDGYAMIWDPRDGNSHEPCWKVFESAEKLEEARHHTPEQLLQMRNKGYLRISSGDFRRFNAANTPPQRGDDESFSLNPREMEQEKLDARLREDPARSEIPSLLVTTQKETA